MTFLPTNFKQIEQLDLKIKSPRNFEDVIEAKLCDKDNICCKSRFNTNGKEYIVLKGQFMGECDEFNFLNFPETVTFSSKHEW